MSKEAGVRDRAAGQQASNNKPKEAGLAAAGQRECGTGRPYSKRATASQRRRGWRRLDSGAGGGRTARLAAGGQAGLSGWARGREEATRGRRRWPGARPGEGGGCTGRRRRPGVRPESANPRLGRLGENWAGPNSSRWQIKRPKRDVSLYTAFKRQNATFKRR
jgi:hypothetical protein